VDKLYHDIIKELDRTGDIMFYREYEYVYFLSRSLKNGVLLIEETEDATIVLCNELKCIGYRELYCALLERINVPLYVAYIDSEDELEAVESLGGVKVNYAREDCDSFSDKYGTYALKRSAKPDLLRFKKITLDDIGTVRGYFSYSSNNTCDHTVGSTFMWRDFFSMEYAIYNDTLIVKLKVQNKDNIDTTAFYLPLGGDRDGAIRKIDEYCKSLEIPVVYCSIAYDELPYLSSRYDSIESYHDSDWSDYLYRAQDLITLAGRRYHGQRNHINQFVKTHESYSFEEITLCNIGEVAEFYNALGKAASKDSAIYDEEREKTLEVLANYGMYGLIGGLIRVDNSVVAFSIGEIRSNTLYIHIEKADPDHKGAHQVINNDFAKHFSLQNTEFINRGEDVGDEGLRIAKTSYHPCELIDKLIVNVK